MCLKINIFLIIDYFMCYFNLNPNVYMLQNRYSYADNSTVAYGSVSDKKLYYSDNGSAKNGDDILYEHYYNYIKNEYKISWIRYLKLDKL